MGYLRKMPGGEIVVGGGSRQVDNSAGNRQRATDIS